MADELRETAVQAALTTSWLGRTYYYLPEVASTNDFLKELAVRNAVPPPAGTVVLANYQNQGRGRFNRRWEAPPDTSLLLSILFRPHWPADQTNWLAMMAGVAAAEAIESAIGRPVALKWPNDVLLEHEQSWRKVSGLLLEGSLAADGRLESAVVGIGINVNTPQEALSETLIPAASLLVVHGKPVSRLALLVNFLARLEAAYTAADQGKSPHSTWVKRLVTLGRPVQVTNYGDRQTITGVAEGADEWGQLLVRDEAGRLHVITAGDVTLR